jgi:SAM-dependent methyltransferase
MSKLVQKFKSWQFNPGFWGLFVNPFYLARRALWNEISAHSALLSGNLLDVGCGTKPYQKLFTTSTYIGLEYDTEVARKRGIADTYYDGKRFPFEDQKFDSVLCNQVLEHVFTPDTFVGELARVVKPGGHLLLTVPFFWDEHEQPYDFARYTTFGLKAILERNGFRVLIQRRLLSDVSVLFQLHNAYLFKVLDSKSLVWKLVMRVFVFAPISLIGLIAAKLLPSNQDMFLDQLIVATRDFSDASDYASGAPQTKQVEPCTA